MTLATNAVLNESQTSYTGWDPPTVLRWTSNWRQRPEITPLPTCVFTYYSEPAPWKQAVLSKIADLRWLGSGWDGPDSEPISWKSIKLAHQLVSQIADTLPSIVKPSVFPTPYFGVLIEWHTQVCDFAFTIQSDGTLDMDYQDTVENLEWEGAFLDHPDDIWATVLANCRS